MRGEKESLYHYWWECKLGAATMENSTGSWKNLKKKTELPYDSAKPLGYISKSK